MINRKVLFWIVGSISLVIVSAVVIVYFVPEKLPKGKISSIQDTKSKGTILIDYSKPSFRKRLWLLAEKKVILNTYVSHGKNSGLIYARDFSNTENSLKSCTGRFITSEIYYGDHGLSMRVIGLDSTNSNAFKRDIVFHSAEYATKRFLLSNGYLGRSHGCFVTSPKDNKKIIDFARNNGPLTLIVMK